jgi:hypothetical protein
MPRWTNSRNDEFQIVRANEEFFKVVELGGNVRALLKDGRTVEGRWIGNHMGNNAGEGGQWHYYGSVTIRTDAWDIEVDLLDIDHFLPVAKN